MTNIASSRRLSTLQIAALILFSSTATAQNLDGSSLDMTLALLIDQHAASQKTAVCLKVTDLESGDVLFDRRGDQLMTPASNLKIYTTACALDRFGPEHRFRTTIRLEGTLAAGHLNGDVVLVGGGDPMCRTDDLRDMAAAIVERFQLKSVCGSIRVDNSRYAMPLKGPGWMWDDEPYYFNMSITPMMVDFNVLTVRVNPATIRPTVELVPASDEPPLVVEPIDATVGNQLEITRRPFTEPIMVRGAQSATESSEHRLTMHDPGKWVAGMFQNMLVELGVEISKPDSNTSSPAGRDGQELAFPGPRLADVLNHFNEVSENAIGEVLLHEIAIAAGKASPRWQDGAESISEWLVNTAGLERGSFRLVDGSGLSRYNLISADSSIRLLQFMNRHMHAKVFFESLPTYDVEVGNESKVDSKANEKVAPRVRAKGGSMSGVSTCSGTVRTLNGRTLAFSYLTNGFLGASKPQKALRQEVWQTLIQSHP